MSPRQNKGPTPNPTVQLLTKTMVPVQVSKLAATLWHIAKWHPFGFLLPRVQNLETSPVEEVMVADNLL